MTDVLQFLHNLFKSGKSDTSGLSYSSLGTARSALSTVATIQSIPVGQHPMIKRFMRAAFNLRPSFPKNNVIWDVNFVIRHLKTLSPTTSLSLRNLSKKLLMLMLILAGQRGQSIHLLDISNMTLTHSHVSFRIAELTKTSRPSAHVPELHFQAYTPDKRVCIITVLRIFLSRTEHLRKQEQRLFITTRPPYKAASRDTIRRWTRDILTDAGIDMNIFSPHSTRSASASKAATKLPLRTILSTAGWSQESVFQKFYNKPIVQTTSYADAILQ